MPTRIIFPENDKAAGVIEAQKQTTTNDKFAELFYHAKMAAGSGFLLSLGVFGVFGAMMFYFPGLRQYWQGFLVFSAACGFIWLGVTGVMWTTEGATHSWKMERKLLERQWELENAMLLESEDDPDHNLPLSSDGARLKQLAAEFIFRHYENKKELKRPDCEKENICNQAEWNTVNKVFQALHIKHDRRWNDELDTTEAMRRLFDDAYFEPNGKVRVKVDENEWKAVV